MGTDATKTVLLPHDQEGGFKKLCTEICLDPLLALGFEGHVPIFVRTFFLFISSVSDPLNVHHPSSVERAIMAGHSVLDFTCE